MPEKRAHGLLDVQHPRCAAHHNHALDVGFGHACVFQRLLHGFERFGDQMLRERVKFGARDVYIQRGAVAQSSLHPRFRPAAQFFFGGAHQSEQ